MVGTSCHSPIVVDSSPLVAPVSLPASKEHQTTPLPHEKFPPTIHEGDEFSSTGLPKSPAKPLPASSLRQPTARIESKIPRVGSKPYARPTAAATARTRLLIPAAAKKPSSSIPTPAVARPLRIVPKVPSKPKLPVEVESSSTPSTLDVAIASQPPVVTAENVTVTSLKRKREAEGSRTSPTGTRPVVFIRKVVSAPANPKPSPLPLRIASPVKAGRNPATVQGRVQMRKVVGAKKSRSPATTTTTTSLAPPEAEPEEPKDRPARITEGTVVVADVATESNETAGFALPDSGAAVASNAQSMPLVPLVSEPTSSAEEAHAADAPQQSAEPFNPPPSIEVEPESSAPLSSGLRRTTRSSRKSAEAATDVFGAATCTTTAAAAATTTTTTTTRRSSKMRGGRPTILGPPDTSAFSSMSMLALRSLTAANTERNQKQVAELQTEVVVKEGKRPDSPTTKVRTVLEKQKEEKSLEREKRAARRAQRLSQDTAADAPVDGNGDKDDGDGEEEEEEEEESVMSLDDEVHSNLTGHRRGPGDEEDYTTPERPERPLKRGRFETEELQKEKNVKWDRGLSTTVWLDDSPPEPKRTKDDAARKGCLAPSSKSLRLDTMGNVLNIESPLTLVVENITVKKFVYEGDAEEQEIPPEPPKMTRSKKKAKTS
ncbi:hypothetical protein EW026_g1274 [Hermanssonia centrifuga]|uniref:Uncharacterized protein n=1 Tax=Hermanssonia centrifuga TaxID=98765 RepID=A0A4V3XBC1_9APHY|nr:hypothetical protein EW026_g1274 [Hermanssonia centrifuga]